MPAGPLPDFVEGRVLEKENVHLTADIRKRMPFLNHVPLYTDIVFVELDLSHLLSDATKRKFKNDFAKRRKKRQSKVQAEKRADLLAQKEDQNRINERKARLQTVDPEDEFFHAAAAMSLMESEASGPVLEGADFGPALGNEGNPDNEAEASSFSINDTVASRNTDSGTTSPSSPSVSFSQAARRASAADALAADSFPALSSSTAFPSLRSRPSAPTPPAQGGSTWGSVASAPKLIPSAPPGNGKKKKKAQKLVLFSTGGARGY
mmetsp:Transcript_14180/g.31790  ORF Transcript_14180/g.31790 Transcript_14180/m.31790 type:complete len:264 (-) Transcript_14180:140-931(-)